MGSAGLFLGILLHGVGRVFQLAGSVVETILERTDTFAEPFHQFGDFLAAEKQQDNQGDDNPFGAAGEAEQGYEVVGHMQGKCANLE